MEMADDIDDLLNEVESKFLTSGGKQPTQPVSQWLSQTKSSQLSKNTRPERGTHNDKELDAMIEDIFEDSDKDTQHKNRKYRHSSEPNHSDHTMASNLPGLHHKCHPVYIGGSSDAKGLATAINKRICDKLRCTDCDFRVASFDNYKWHPSTDYLFLRNNMPDFDKLRVKLVSKKGYRAYSCQCRWYSVNALTDLQTISGLKWVCGKH
ncbi:hypothetical protein LSAT2_032659 [Lamellibrachia satsuma]|nr:hypothetical protein LSAT2_032659 [Lamellibrachia satsuma]